MREGRGRVTQVREGGRAAVAGDDLRDGAVLLEGEFGEVEVGKVVIESPTAHREAETAKAHRG